MQQADCSYQHINSPLGGEEGASGVDIGAGGCLDAGGAGRGGSLLRVVVADGAGRALGVALVLGLVALGAPDAPVVCTNSAGRARLGHVGVHLQGSEQVSGEAIVRQG